MPSDVSYNQLLIGILQWIEELGHVDICLEVSMMSSHLALPRKGHMEQVMQIFGYLKKYHSVELIFDPSNPTINEQVFENERVKKNYLPTCPNQGRWDS